MPAKLARLVTLSAILVAMTILVFSAAQAQDAVNAEDQAATRQVIDQQIAAFRSGSHDRAYSFAAPNIRQVFPTVEGFIAMVQGGYMPLYQPDSYVFGKNALIGAQVLQEVIVTDPSGRQWQAVYTLERQVDGSWKIAGVRLNPYKGVSA